MMSASEGGKVVDVRITVEGKLRVAKVPMYVGKSIWGTESDKFENGTGL